MNIAAAWELQQLFATTPWNDATAMRFCCEA
jgi:hypothetical protein